MILAAGLMTAAMGCIQVDGKQILARELAAAMPAFSSLPPEMPLGYSPAPGARRIMGHGALVRLAGKYEITPPAAGEVCFERRSEVLTPERLMEAIRSTLEDDDVRIDLLDFSRHRVPLGELVFKRSGLGTPAPNRPDAAVMWRGHITYDETRSVPVWARVRLLRTESILIAVEDLRAGRPIQAGQIRVEKREAFPFAERPLSLPEQALSKSPRRAIRAGAAIYGSALVEPFDVERGGTVMVQVLSGAARLKFEARAEQAGEVGDVITMRNPAGGRFRARVEGKNRAVVDADTESTLRNYAGGGDSSRGRP